LLGLLDHCIKDANVTVNLQEISADDMGKSSSNCFCFSMRPTLFFLVLVAGTLWEEKTGAFGVPNKYRPSSETVVACFPYAAALLLYLASIGPIASRFNSQENEARDATDYIREMLKTNVESLANDVKSRVAIDIEKELEGATDFLGKNVEQTKKSVSVDQVALSSQFIWNATREIFTELG